jgi:hypothetical protein
VLVVHPAEVVERAAHDDLPRIPQLE